MERTPPVEVRRTLRREVGFGCPAPGCANPYLEYHHFDPPWRDRQHHDPNGMIALCAEHHRKADGGSYTNEQLRTLKRPAEGVVGGRFDWLRNDVLAYVGGTFYYETPTIFQFKTERAIWFERDDEGNMLLSIRMVTSSGEPRLSLRNNDWMVLGNPVDFESPPSGKRIQAKYSNGDILKVDFSTLANLHRAKERYPKASERGLSNVRYPVTVVEVEQLFGGSDFGFGPSWTRLGGATISGGFVSRCGTGLVWG
jgi:hypothetical protein